MKKVSILTVLFMAVALPLLLFAYSGTSLPLVLLVALKMEPGVPITMVLNYNPVLSELIKSAVGCIGMFLSMPAAAIICIKLHSRGGTGACQAAPEMNG